jgi:hypothetical protein
MKGQRRRPDQRDSGGSRLQYQKDIGGLRQYLFAPASLAPLSRIVADFWALDGMKKSAAVEEI